MKTYILGVNEEELFSRSGQRRTGGGCMILGLGLGDFGLGYGDLSSFNSTLASGNYSLLDPYFILHFPFGTSFRQINAD